MRLFLQTLMISTTFSMSLLGCQNPSAFELRFFCFGIDGAPVVETQEAQRCCGALDRAQSLTDDQLSAACQRPIEDLGMEWNEEQFRTLATEVEASLAEARALRGNVAAPEVTP